MQRSELADVPTLTKLQPNNVLLSDPLYSRVFRAWKWLRDDENSLRETWGATLERSCILLCWMVAANLASQKRVVVMESIGRIHTGRGEGHVFGVELLGVEDSRAVWQINPELHFLVQPKGNKETAFQIRVSVEGEYILAHLVTLTGQGALYEASTSAFSFKVVAAPERLMSKRGVGIIVDGLETALPEAGNGYADIAGLTYFAEQIAGQILRHCRLNFTKVKSKPIHSYIEKDIENKARLGINLGDTSIHVNIEQPVPLSAAAWTMALELPDEVKSFEWLNGRADRHIIYGAAARSLWTSGDVFEADGQSNAGMLSLSINRLLGNLKDELHTTTDTRIAYVVPDFIDEFSQRSLRSAFSSSFQNPVPVWRSVAAAIAWASSNASHVSQNESILVVDTEFMEVSQTVLTARFDDKLKRGHPTSQGIYWERKPPLPPDENLEVPGWPHVLREYAHHIVNHALASLHEDQKSRIVDDLLRTGLIAKLVNDGGSVFIQIPSSRNFAPDVVELFEDYDWFDDYVDRWVTKVMTGVEAARRTVHVKQVLLTGGGVGYDRFKKVQEFTGRIKKYDHNKSFGFIKSNGNRPEDIFFHNSSVQKNSRQLKADDYVVFDIGDGKKGVEAKNVEVISPLSLRLQDRITISPSMLALGARECLLRLDTGCLTWQEWLPELSLELIRDGHYGELQLLERGKFIDPFLGKQEQFTIPEKLTLHSGKKWFSFPLLMGRQDRRPIAWEARLESSVFPLKRNIEVELQLSYRYGLENSYELSVVPVMKEHPPFERIVAKWMRGHVSDNAYSSNESFTFQSSPWNEEDSEKFVSATKSLEQINDEKFGKFLFAITRICWSQGRTIASAPLKVQQVFPSFRDQLFDLVSQSPIQTAQKVPRAFEILALLHVDAPTELIELLLSIDDNAVDNATKKTLALIENLVGDGCAERQLLLKRLLDHLNRHTNSATFSPALAGMSIRAIGNAAWRHPKFITSLAAESGAVKLIIWSCQRSLNNLLRKVPSEISTEEKRTEVERRDGTLFRDTCELLLALLRIDQSNPEVALLKCSSSSADALAKVIRQLDARFVAIGVHIHWRVKLNANVDEALHRMSPVAFTLNTFLAEGSGSNLVQITGVDMD